MLTTTQPPKSKRRWYQFSLLTLLVVMTLFSIGVGWIGLRVQRARQNRHRVALAETDLETEAKKLVPKIEELDGIVRVRHKQRALTWLEKLFDDPGSADGELTIRVIGLLTFNDAGLEHVKGLTEVKELNLELAATTDAGLTHLKGMPKLRMLVLGATNVTDAGLEHLKGLTELRSVILYATNVTDEGIKKLQKALPNCKIHHSPKLSRKILALPNCKIER